MEQGVLREIPQESRPLSPDGDCTNGDLYGTTLFGGVNNACGFPGCGTVFKITREGVLTTIYSFCSQPGCVDGALPYAGLTQGTDGNLYGTTWQGGNGNEACYEGCGTVFRISREGALTTLYSFCSQPGCMDGSSPQAGLVQATDGNFYGTTYDGGTDGEGTVFSLSMGLGPFVTFVHSAGKVGQTGGILGQGLTGTTSVMLNGIPASFTVVSDTFIRATVPAGATTGYVTVTTPSGMLTSNVPFHVLK
jgi:uncharacterized repeat protein (TIGR03803 family)